MNLSLKNISNIKPNSFSNDSKVKALLGPTNTGKTYYAMDRMLSHRTGIIGFPLRLLARENYDKAVLQLGKSQVALVTGEEKIIPPNAKYFCCTVESMPLEKSFAFVAIDEIQLAADPDRGYIFTDRILNARGSEETVFLGAETIKPLLQKILPKCSIEIRPRLSVLSYVGIKKITRLKPRSAVVAFSVPEVYKIAELVRTKKGGAAIVMGALSPRTRNAQVELYQSGQVDYLIATDAIGMGLNMDIDHVAFASDTKFDGNTPRYLTPPEIAQIAGRAGRHSRNGSFGVVEDNIKFDEDTIDQIESHSFSPLKTIWWRNTELDFNSLKRIGKLSKEIESIKTPLIMIDHHESPEKFSTLFLSNPKIGSTCEIIYNIMKSINSELIDKEIATYIYSGILTDTGSFRYPLTTGDTHTIISELFKKGINHTKIHERIYDNFSFKRAHLLAVALKNLKKIETLGVVYTFLTKEDLEKHNFKKGDTEGFVNFGLRIKDIYVSVIFIEDSYEDIIKISFRSKENIDVNKFAKKYFNGGGHKNASGGYSNDSIIETEKKFISSIKEFFRV